MFDRIVVGYDDSPGARTALEMAIGLALAHGSELTVVAVEEHRPLYAPVVGEIEEERPVEEIACREWLARADADARARGVRVHAVLRCGHPAQQLSEAAVRHRADLLILGRSGHSGVWGRFIGSTAEKTARHTDCSVLIAQGEPPA